jgi:hypothetical protein
VLTGHTFEAEGEGMNRLLSGHMLSNAQTAGFFQDDVKFLWDYARDKQCLTMLNDDIGISHYGMFHYFTFKGFHRPPTDFYFRPFYEFVIATRSSSCSDSSIKNSAHRNPV